jgi:hypothetical protein
MAGGGRELAWRFYFSIGVTNACDNDDVAAASCLFMGLHTIGLETMQLNQRRQIGQQGDFFFCSVLRPNRIYSHVLLALEIQGKEL